MRRSTLPRARPSAGDRFFATGDHRCTRECRGSTKLALRQTAPGHRPAYRFRLYERYDSSKQTAFVCMSQLLTTFCRLFVNFGWGTFLTCRRRDYLWRNLICPMGRFAVSGRVCRLFGIRQFSHNYSVLPAIYCTLPLFVLWDCYAVYL